MSLYLSDQELIARIHIGKAVEQWLSHTLEADYIVIKWLTIYKGEEQKFEVTYFESFDEGDEEFYDVHEFGVIDPENYPYGITHAFDSVRDAMDFAIERYRTAVDKFVSSGMIYQEYERHLLNKK